MIFKIFGLMILLCFYGTYFIKMFLQKRKGIKTNHLGKGKHGLEKVIEISISVASILVPVVEVFSIFIVCTNLNIGDWLRYLGLFFGICGLVFFIISVVTMKNNWRAGISESEKTELVTNGIYKVSRNPAFLGFDLVYIGFVLMFFNWILFSISFITILIFHLQITKVEEPFLIKTFGIDYENYKKNVCRYFGKKISG